MLDGSGIREAREAAGLSQQELADKVGTTQQTIDRIEKNTIRRTSYGAAIVDTLGIETIGMRLSKRRLIAGMSMDELAKKMGFAGQSSIQRYLDPAYNLELRPDLARKFDDALGAVAKNTPTDTVPANDAARVIDIAIACGADGAKVLKALEVAGYVLFNSGLYRNGRPVIEGHGEVDDPLAYISGVCERHKITTTQLARNVGLAPSTLNKKLNGRMDGGFNAATLRKIKEWDAKQ